MTKYPSLNGLRAISIILVLLNHLAIQNNIFGSLINNKWLFPFIRVISDGQLGVNVFFVISGFLITSLMLNEERKTNTVSFKSFYIRRTLRIFPAYYSLLLFYFILQILGYIKLDNESWLTSVTYTKYFNFASHDWYTGHGWSLSIEEHFYLLWPLVFLKGGKIRKFTVLFFISIVPFIRCFQYYHPVSWIGEASIFTRIDSISVGCFCALYKDSIIKKLTLFWHIVFILSASLLFFSSFVIILLTKAHLSFLFIPFGKTYGTIANILIASIMMYSVFGPKGIWFKFLNFKVINFIGILSYSIYLWQEFFIYKSALWINRFPQNIFLVTVVASCSYFFIEQPFLKLKSRFQSI